MEERKVAFITGGSRGIGKEVATKFAEKGYNIVINYVSDKTDVESLKREWESKGINALILKADVTKTEEVEAVVKTAIDTFGKIAIALDMTDKEIAEEVKKATLKGKRK